MDKPKKIFVLIILLALISGFIDLPSEIPLNLSLGPLKINQTFYRPDLNFKLGPFSINKNLKISQGLDLKGGTHLVFETDMADIQPEDRQDALTSVQEIIHRRIDLYGVVEPLIQTSVFQDQYRVIVELPGITDTQQAVELIGMTAQLDFRQQSAVNDQQTATQPAELSALLNFEKTGLTGKDLAKSQAQFDQSNAGSPVVSLSFNEAGKEKFARITQNNIGKRLAIFLDDQILTAPVVNEAITGGNAVISGDFTLDEAKNLAIQLNAGALPVPIKIIEERTVGATLGQDSVIKSIRAGAIGLSMVIAFMAIYYKWLGVIADLALLVYGLITLAVYKLIPITLTLPGLAGFILSVGMAVDSNILIFERMKEEERSGKPLKAAMELGFGRAWDSIKDANIATLMTTFVLLNPFEWSFLPTSGMARGFALTLGIGVLTSLFTGIVVSRTFMRVLYHKKEKEQNNI